MFYHQVQNYFAPNNYIKWRFRLITITFLWLKLFNGIKFINVTLTYHRKHLLQTVPAIGYLKYNKLHRSEKNMLPV